MAIGGGGKKAKKGARAKEEYLCEERKTKRAESSIGSKSPKKQSTGYKEKKGYEGENRTGALHLGSKGAAKKGTAQRTLLLL